jgi:hypothetical protein
MGQTRSIEPIVGDWYRSHGQLFEVVAIDDIERVLEIQHADGDLEEMDFDDWATRCRAGSLDVADAPEDARLATDSDHEDPDVLAPQTFNELNGLYAVDELGDLDLFD